MINLNHEAIIQIEQKTGLKITDVHYKLECIWSQKDGWHFAFGNKRMWEISQGFVIADYVEECDVGKPTKESEYKQKWYANHEQFLLMQDALDYMRTGDNEKATGNGPKR